MEMPASEVEIDEAIEEGIQFIYQVTPQKIIGRDGEVSALECIRMEMTEDANSGRRHPVPIPGSEFLLEVDNVILAIGQIADLSFITPQDGISITPNGTIALNPDTLATGRPGVFAGGGLRPEDCH